MGFWRALRSGASALFSGDSETGAKVVDGVMSGIDYSFFSEEERSEANLKQLELRIEFAKSTTGSRLARRYIAIMVVGTYLFWFSVAGFCILFDALEKAEALSALLTSLAVGGSFVAIISWYFYTGVNRTNGRAASGKD